MAYPNIQLSVPVLIQEERLGTDVKVIRVEETPIQKLVTAEITINGTSRWLQIWSGDAYDAVGQWTDTDIEERIKQLLNN